MGNGGMGDEVAEMDGILITRESHQLLCQSRIFKYNLFIWLCWALVMACKLLDVACGL